MRERDECTRDFFVVGRVVIEQLQTADVDKLRANRYSTKHIKWIET